MYQLRKIYLGILLLVVVIAGATSHVGLGGPAALTAPLKVFAVELLDASVDDCKKIDDYCVRYLHDDPILTLFDYTLVDDASGKSVVLNIGQKGAEALNRAVEKYHSDKLAIVYQGDVLMVPQVKDHLSGDRVVLTFNDNAAYEKLKAIAGGR